jgi:hypothetical protein
MIGRDARELLALRFVERREERDQHELLGRDHR